MSTFLRIHDAPLHPTQRVRTWVLVQEALAYGYWGNPQRTLVAKNAGGHVES